MGVQASLVNDAGLGVASRASVLPLSLHPHPLLSVFGFRI